MTTSRSNLPRARKRFGQHFLETAWVEKLLRVIAPSAGETFIEIGPGRGAITTPLAAASRRVVAFEIDRDLGAALRSSGAANLTVVEGDFLDVTPGSLSSVLTPEERRQPIRIAGNLPYNVASPIVFKLLDLFEAGLPFLDAHLMLQREVADRLTATPGTRDYGVLTVLIGRLASVDRVLTLPPGAFRPAPKVYSAVVRLRFHAGDPPVKDTDAFRSLVRTVFTKRRKMIGTALGPRGRAALMASGIDPHRRPETLTIRDFARLADALAEPALSKPPSAVL
jgi:16S rRNA (adenine1518-N6/adenine1519-N6)-dimethyltransferase